MVPVVVEHLFFEMLLAPRHHSRRFEDADDDLPAVAQALRESLERLCLAHGDPPYNLVVHSLPPRSRADYHWHMHIWPRLQAKAGFERGTGIAVDTVDPAEAAEAAATFRAIGPLGGRGRDHRPW